MLRLMPQEMEVWYLLPSLRKELAKSFINDYNLSQKKAAQILGVTESAISQYFKSKRAKSLKFDKNDILEIKKTALKIIRDEKNARVHFYNLSKKLKGSKSMCEIHHRFDKTLPKECGLCKQNKH